MSRDLVFCVSSSRVGLQRVIVVLVFLTFWHLNRLPVNNLLEISICIWFLNAGIKFENIICKKNVMVFLELLRALYNVCEMTSIYPKWLGLRIIDNCSFVLYYNLTPDIQC